jgi:hypothetical protein
MPTNKTPLRRAPRQPQFTPEVLKLFAELNAVPPSRRNTDYYRGCARELMRLLNLTTEWWHGANVLDRGSRPIHVLPEYAEHDAWHRCREIREQLLQALADDQLIEQGAERCPCR